MRPLETYNGYTRDKLEVENAQLRTQLTAAEAKLRKLIRTLPPQDNFCELVEQEEALE